jgi:N-acetylglucosamine-6-phosphate deacetylase
MHRVDLLFCDVEAWKLGGSERVDLAIARGQVVARGIQIARDSEAREVIDGRGKRLIPGLVDVHLHGYGGHDVTSGGVPAARAAAAALARTGTTRFLATLYPSQPERLVQLAAEFARCLRDQELEAPLGARIEGLHLEGPFVNPRKAGALDPACLRAPDLDEARALVLRFPGVIRRMTIAPELEGAHEVVRFLLDQGVRPSLGHSDCSATQAELATRLGPLAVTHLFNAMRGVHHREPGLALAALENEDLIPEIICDGVHVDPQVVRWTREVRGNKGLVMISDALWPAGSDVASFEAGGKQIRHGSDAMWAEEGMLAGAKLCLMEMVRARVADGSLRFHEAVAMASYWPARELGLRNDLEPGAIGDAVLLDEASEISGVWLAGQCIFPPIGRSFGASKR